MNNFVIYHIDWVQAVWVNELTFYLEPVKYQWLLLYNSYIKQFVNNKLTLALKSPEEGVALLRSYMSVHVGKHDIQNPLVR